MKIKILFVIASLFQFLNQAQAELKKIEKTTPYTDWNTGLKRDRLSVSIENQGQNVTADDIAKLIHQKHPDLLPYPDIRDVAVISSNEMLVILSRDSQGEPYPLVRLRQTGKVREAELIKVDQENGLFYNWFLDSRINGWSRVLATSGQYLIQHSPFRIVALGSGELAKVEENKAFLVENLSGNLIFYIIDLFSGKRISELKLDKNCFESPSFSFNHPLLERTDLSEDDQQVKYNYGPKWWDKTVSYDLKTKKITLKKTHHLLAPPPGLMAVNYIQPKVDTFKGESVQDLAYSPSVSMAGETEDSDIIPEQNRDCKLINPYGFKENQKKEPYIKNSIFAAELCLNKSELISKKIIQTVCGPIKDKIIFSANSVGVIEKSFKYSPYLKSKKPSMVSAFVIKNKKELIQYISNQQYQEPQTIKSVFVLNSNQVLIVARGSGPFSYYLLSDSMDFELTYLDSFGYPASDFQNINNNQFLYNNSAKVLIQKSPFKLRKYAGHIIKINEQFTVNYSNDDEKLFYLYISKNNDFDQPKLLYKYKINSICLDFDKFTNTSRYLDQENWFDGYFNLSAEGQLKLKFKKANCDLISDKT